LKTFLLCDAGIDGMVHSASVCGWNQMAARRPIPESTVLILLA